MTDDDPHPDQAANQGYKCNEVNKETQLPLSAAIMGGMDDRDLTGVEVYRVEQSDSHHRMVVEVLDDPLV